MRTKLAAHTHDVNKRTAFAIKGQTSTKITTTLFFFLTSLYLTWQYNQRINPNTISSLRKLYFT